MGQFSKNIKLFAQKILTKLSEIWVWDPGSGKNLSRIPDSGVKKPQDPGALIRIRNTAFVSCFHFDPVQSIQDKTNGADPDL